MWGRTPPTLETVRRGTLIIRPALSSIRTVVYNAYTTRQHDFLLKIFLNISLYITYKEQKLLKPYRIFRPLSVPFPFLRTTEGRVSFIFICVMDPVLKEYKGSNLLKIPLPTYAYAIIIVGWFL